LKEESNSNTYKLIIEPFVDVKMLQSKLNLLVNEK